jgi:hypothetical protein
LTSGKDNKKEPETYIALLKALLLVKDLFRTSRMDYFTKLQKLFQTEELCKRRTFQIELENKLDINLKVNQHKCPEISFEFIMAMRKMNRQYSLEIYNSPMIDYAENVSKSLDKADEIYKMYDFTKPEDTCKNIEKILKTIINKHE